MSLKASDERLRREERDRTRAERGGEAQAAKRAEPSARQG